MIDSVAGRHVAQQEGIDAVKAGNVIAELMRVGATLVMRVDATDRAKIMLRRFRVELVKI